MDFARRLTANSLQGLVNRNGARLFLDYGNYDDPDTRRTNSIQMTEEDWFSKYRSVLKRNDLDNLDYYISQYQFVVKSLPDLKGSISQFRHLLKGMVVWDPALLDSVNLALMQASLQDLLVVRPEDVVPYQAQFGLQVLEDLSGSFTDRVEVYTWALKHLFKQCKAGEAAHFEPAWQRAEFSDYIVQNKLFTFNLSCHKKGGLRDLGQKLLLLLVAGPLWLRNLLFDTRLDAIVRWLGMRLQEIGAPETKLGNHIQGSIESLPYPTIFGWHTDRDDELAFMLSMSANGLRLAPSFLASNYSFHSQLLAQVAFKQNYASPDELTLQNKTYLTFTLSDGDQLTLMNTAEVGNWRRPEHGKVPFNWEVQPLLVEIAPALLGYFYQHLTPADMLVAGPSGAGYVIPPLVPDLRTYMRESARLCDMADIRITTSYTSNPPRRVLRAHAEAPGNFMGFISGYFHLNCTPMTMAGERPFVSYTWPHVDQIGLPVDKVLAGIRAQIEQPSPMPRFLACHLFAYRTTVADIYHFVQTLDPQKVEVVRADQFLLLASQYITKENSPMTLTSASEKLPNRTKVLYGVADLGIQALTAAIQFWMLFFFTDVVHIDPGLAGTALMVGKLTWDAINDPLLWLPVGQDPFPLGTAATMADVWCNSTGLSSWLLFSIPDGLTGLKAFIAVLFTFLLFDTFHSAVSISYYALTPELTYDYRERTSLTTIREVFTVLGYIVGAGITKMVADIIQAKFGITTQQSWSAVGASFGLVAVLTVLTTAFTIRERKRADFVPSKMPPFKMFSACFKNKPFMQLMAAQLLSSFSFTLLTTLLSYYTIYQVKMENQLTLIMLILLGCIGIFLFPWRYVSDKLNKGPSYALGLFIASVAVITTFFFPNEPTPWLYVVVAVAGLGFSGQWVFPWSMLPDVIEYDEVITGERHEGVYYGMWQFLGKFTGALGIAASGWALKLFGYVANQPQQTERALLGIRLFFGPVPAIVLILSLPLLIWYPITRKTHAELVKKIASQAKEKELH